MSFEEEYVDVFHNRRKCYCWDLPRKTRFAWCSSRNSNWLSDSGWQCRGTSHFHGWGQVLISALKFLGLTISFRSRLGYCGPGRSSSSITNQENKESLLSLKTISKMVALATVIPSFRELWLELINSNSLDKTAGGESNLQWLMENSYWLLPKWTLWGWALKKENRREALLLAHFPVDFLDNKMPRIWSDW